jgi:hypothetical protein
VSHYHPENLCLSTLKGWAKRLSAGAPDIFGHPIPLNQAHALIAVALGYEDWHQAGVILKPNSLEKTLVETPVTRLNDETFPSVNRLFRLINFSLNVGLGLVDGLDKLIALPLPPAVTSCCAMRDPKLSSQLLFLSTFWPEN